MNRSAQDIARAAAAAHKAPEGATPPATPTPPVSEPAPDIAITAVAELGRMVRTARKARRMPQQALADLAGVGRRFLSELENGKPTLEIGKVLQVLAACGIDLTARPRR